MRNFIVDANVNVYSNCACSFSCALTSPPILPSPHLQSQALTIWLRLYCICVDWIGKRLDCTWKWQAISARTSYLRGIKRARWMQTGNRYSKSRTKTHTQNKNEMPFLIYQVLALVFVSPNKHIFFFFFLIVLLSLCITIFRSGKLCTFRFPSWFCCVCVCVSRLYWMWFEMLITSSVQFALYNFRVFDFE